MEQKNFYKAFNSLYFKYKEAINIYNKDGFYRFLFSDIYYLLDGYSVDNDSVRKITSGNSTIHVRVFKIICTDQGFELLRHEIEQLLIKSNNQDRDNNNLHFFYDQIFMVLYNDSGIPLSLKEEIKKSVVNNSIFEISRAIAAVLVCLNHSDYTYAKKKIFYLKTDFMRLKADQPLANYPRYISDSPNCGVSNMIGRKKDLEVLKEVVTIGQNNILITSVGGLGKTELVKEYLNIIMQTETNDSGIEAVAWVPYNNHDIRLSIKQSLRFQCELDAVWDELQNLSYKYMKRFLLVVDNIELTEKDEYLNKLGNLQCRIIVTSRNKELIGFPKVLLLQPLQIDECRELFYYHYNYCERDNEIVNDIIELTARLTIMIVFIAKASFLEELSLHSLYAKLVEKGYKISEEDVSCEHEKLQDDKTIIQQMCLLFSLINIDEDKTALLTFISIIPNLQFDYPKAKKWFNVKKNSTLMKLFKMGMLEHVTKNRKNIYWMHSVIAAAIREQQKDRLYGLSRPFISILTEELNTGSFFGKEYEKAYLIPFSWSVSDIMEQSWENEKDTDFLTSLFHVCFACSNYSLCERLINLVILIQTKSSEFTVMDLAYSYRNKIDLLLQFDRAQEASEELRKVEKLFDDNEIPQERRNILNSQYGILFQIRGDFEKSRKYFEACINDAKESKEPTREKDLSTACSNMARMLVDAGDFFEAYDYIKQAIDIENTDDIDSDIIICYSTLGSICTELMGAGFGTTYCDEANDAFKKVIRFREKHLGKHHADTAIAYHDYSYFWYLCGVYDEALKYNQMANTIEEELFSDYSITRMRNLNTKALIVWEQGDYKKANETFEYIIYTSARMSEDYLIDVADFEFNYARCLHDEGNDEGAKDYYTKCIEIWNKLSATGNRKLMMAHQERGDILFSQGNPEKALIDYEKAEEYNTEDFYIMVDLIDSIAACLILCDRTTEGIQRFSDVLQLLVEYEVKDSETKFQLCSNLFCIIDATSDDEKFIKKQLLEKIVNEPPLLKYVENYLKTS